jgi:hypothetical protein
MYCPNCGSQNKKKQNYCRYCGLHLPDIEKLFSNQLIFGKDSKQLKKIRNVGEFLKYAQIFVFVLLAWGVFKLATSNFDGGKDLIKIGVVSFFLIQMIRGVIGYLQRQNQRKNFREIVSIDAKQSKFEAKKTNKLIEEKAFSPISGVTEKSTELLFVDKKSNVAGKNIETFGIETRK